MEVVTKIAEGGRVVVPSAFRRALGIEPGDPVIMMLDDDEVRLLTPDRAIQSGTGDRVQLHSRRPEPGG